MSVRKTKDSWCFTLHNVNKGDHRQLVFYATECHVKKEDQRQFMYYMTCCLLRLSKWVKLSDTSERSIPYGTTKTHRVFYCLEPAVDKRFPAHVSVVVVHHPTA